MNISIYNLLAFFASFGVLAVVVVNAETKLTIIHVNDHHSHLSEDTGGYVDIFDNDIPSEISSKNGDTTNVRAYFGGYPRIVTAFQELSQDASSRGRDVMKLHAGDAITGTSFFTIFRGDADGRPMTHVCFDAFVPGNHEFDNGDAGLAQFLTALKTEADASSNCEAMPALLGANIVPHNESALLDQGVPPIGDHVVLSMSDGEQVGVIGITTVRKIMESSSPDPGTKILDEKETVKAQVEALTELGVNKIVVMTHIGYQNDIDWIAGLDGVDVVVGGDSHTLLGDDQTGMIATPRGSYATVIEKADGTKACIVQAWEYAKTIGNLDVDFDDDGDVVSCIGSPVFPLDPDSVTVRDADPRYDLSAQDAAALIASLEERTGGQTKGFAEDPDAAADLAIYYTQLQTLVQVVVGVASEFIGLEKGGWESGACDLVAQAFLLHPLSIADVAIQNRGGCRTSIEDGNFTIDDGYSLLPFKETIVNIFMTSKQIKNVLEDAIDFFLVDAASRGAYPRASGLRFDVTLHQPKGSRITNMEINSKLAGSWEAIDMDDDDVVYTVVTNGYIASGKDGYKGFGTMAEELKVDTYIEYGQAFIDYIMSVGTLEPVPADFASTKNYNNETEAPTDDSDRSDEDHDDVSATSLLHSSVTGWCTMFVLFASSCAFELF